jgi:hypothetical protein
MMLIMGRGGSAVSSVSGEELVCEAAGRRKKGVQARQPSSRPTSQLSRTYWPDPSGLWAIRWYKR